MPVKSIFRVLITTAIFLLAIRRGDVKALVGGDQAPPCRLVVAENTFVPNNGEAIIRRRCNYVNPVPRDATDADVMNLLSSLGDEAFTGAKPKAAPPTQQQKGATSPPPAQTKSKDSVDF